MDKAEITFKTDPGVLDWLICVRLSSVMLR